jgi:hypothetical protein
MGGGIVGPGAAPVPLDVGGATAYWQVSGAVAQNQRALPAPRDVHTHAARIAFMHGVTQVVSVLASQSTPPFLTSAGQTPGFSPASVPASPPQLTRTHAYSIVLVPGGDTQVQYVAMPAGPHVV